MVNTDLHRHTSPIAIAADTVLLALDTKLLHSDPQTVIAGPVTKSSPQSLLNIPAFCLKRSYLPSRSILNHPTQTDLNIHNRKTAGFKLQYVKCKINQNRKNPILLLLLVFVLT